MVKYQKDMKYTTMKISPSERSRLAKLAAEADGRWKGEKNPNYGKSSSKWVKEIWDQRTEEERKQIGKKVSQTRKKRGVAAGKNNPMYGRSAPKEQRLRWYNNGEQTIFVTEGTQPEDYVRGRGKIK